MRPWLRSIHVRDRNTASPRAIVALDASSGWMRCDERLEQQWDDCNNAGTRRSCQVQPNPPSTKPLLERTHRCPRMSCVVPVRLLRWAWLHGKMFQGVPGCSAVFRGVPNLKKTKRTHGGHKARPGKESIMPRSLGLSRELRKLFTDRVHEWTDRLFGEIELDSRGLEEVRQRTGAA